MCAVHVYSVMMPLRIEFDGSGHFLNKGINDERQSEIRVKCDQHLRMFASFKCAMTTFKLPDCA